MPERDDATNPARAALARGFGRGRIVVANLYALRARDPTALLAHPDPVGPENGRSPGGAGAGERATSSVRGAITRTRAGRRRRRRLLAGRGARLWHLGRTKSGAPRHPLYVPRDVEPTRFDSPSP